MSWDSGNNASGGDGWGVSGSGGDSQWNGGNDAPWDGGNVPWGGSNDAQWNSGGDAQWNSGGGAETSTTFDNAGGQDYNNAYGNYYNNDYGAGGDDEGKKPARTPRPGDWDCPECGVSNFASRQECFKCSAAKPEGAGAPARTPRPGDWDCPECGTSNFASRQECFKCSAARPEGVGAPPARAPRPGDWDCPECNTSNFATRTECFKCHAARPAGMGVDPPLQRPERSYNWASNRARYEYNENAVGEDGMAPRDKELEAELFGTDPSEQQTPLDFSKYANIPITVERGDAPPPVQSFDAADLHPVMKENIRLAGYTQPTPVQTYSIPIVTAGKDLMACAQTGSGKTAAFLIPTLSGLFGRAKELAQPRPAPFEQRHFKAEPLVLIIAPTRELCSQIFDECRKFTYRSMLRPCAVYGGADTLSQLRQLERGCDILAASPGRLMDFIERGKVSLKRVRYLVLDEADRMLDMGFEAVIRAIVEKRGLNPDRQTLMYSATFPRAIRKLARDFLRPDYLFLKVGRVGGTTSSITQKIMYVEEEDKREALRTLLNSQPPSRTLIFVETKRSADSLDQYLYERSFPSTSIHGDRTQMEREDALLAFKNGRCPILVATAVAARGIDIRNVMHVINYDMPDNMDEYIHRIGRTARVGRSGLATSFYNERSSALAPELTKLLKECNQVIPDFLQPYVTEEITWEEDLPEEDVPKPSYAGQEYIPPERNPPGGAPAAAPADGGDSSWNADGGAGWGSGADGQDFGSGGYGDSSSKPAPREGDWDCPNCGQSNFARRSECFKCNTAKPEGLGGGGERRGPRPRREGDWDCSCGAVNFARRSDCYKCGSMKPGDDSAAGGNDWNAGGASSGDAWGANTTSGGDWNAGAASSGWGQSETTAAPGGDGWGAPAASTPAAPSGGDGWGAPVSTPAAPSGGDGWGAPAASTPAAPSDGDGWGASAAPSGGNGWGAPAASSPAAASGNSEWGAPAPRGPSPNAAPCSVPAPATANGGWGATNPTNGPSKPAPANNGWGAPAPAEEKVTNAMDNMKINDAPSDGDGWGPPPTTITCDGWGAPPEKPTGFGW